MNFFITALSFSPFITNVIWFTQATSSEIDSLLSNNGKRLPSNVLGSDFEFKDLLHLLMLQKPPFKTRAGYIFDSNYESCGVSDFQKALQLFSESKEQMGELTRKRIEMISNKAFQDRSLIDSQGKVSIYRGRAGTGKTVGLIQTAISLVDEKSARVLMLEMVIGKRDTVIIGGTEYPHSIVKKRFLTLNASHVEYAMPVS